MSAVTAAAPTMPLRRNGVAPAQPEKVGGRADAVAVLEGRTPRLSTCAVVDHGDLAQFADLLVRELLL
ncbi:hypothetical protein [Nocardia sp. NPDC051463]|uniref:hypothetical protein n=1 Tax=Nocardia sp. NPDC051463 TaxID=3154845 RepID=UPI0034340586